MSKGFSLHKRDDSVFGSDWLRAGRTRGRSSSPDGVVQTGSGVHQTSYPTGKGDSFPGGKAAVV
jgi:hypothetical protein